MNPVCVRYGVPWEIERWETLYPGRGNVLYKKIESTVWVDVGDSEFLLAHNYEAWMERHGLVWTGPLLDFDIALQDNGTWGQVHYTNNGGEVIDPEPMEVDDESEPIPMEIDGHEHDVFVDGHSDSDPEEFLPTPEDSDPEELPSSEDSGAETE